MFFRPSDKRSDSIGQFDPGAVLLGQLGVLSLEITFLIYLT